MVQGPFKVGIPESKNCSALATNVAQASIFHRLSLFTAIREMLSHGRNPSSIPHLFFMFCSSKETQLCDKIKAARKQILHLFITSGSSSGSLLVNTDFDLHCVHNTKFDINYTTNPIKNQAQKTGSNWRLTLASKWQQVCLLFLLFSITLPTNRFPLFL